jgi:hypothetical protein
MDIDFFNVIYEPKPYCLKACEGFWGILYSKYDVLCYRYANRTSSILHL